MKNLKKVILFSITIVFIMFYPGQEIHAAKNYKTSVKLDGSDIYDPDRTIDKCIISYICSDLEIRNYDDIVLIDKKVQSREIYVDYTARFKNTGLEDDYSYITVNGNYGDEELEEQIKKVLSEVENDIEEIIDIDYEIQSVVYEITYQFYEEPDPSKDVVTKEGFVLRDATTLVKYQGSAKNVVIPKGVTVILEGAFLDCTQITSIKVPQGVTKIGDKAFRGCTKLKTISLPEGLVSIGEYAFDSCESLTEVKIPKGVTKISSMIFYDCIKLTSVSIPDGVTLIGDNAFNGCISLKSIEIPDSVTVLEMRAFIDCESLTSIKIPDGVTNIPEQLFLGCYKLKKVNIPEGVTLIGIRAFESCKSLTSIYLPKSVTFIGHYAFRECYKLQTVNIPKGVTKINYYTFSSCRELTNIEIPNSVTEIDSLAFSNCNFKSIVIPKTVKIIGRGAFAGNPLTSVIIENGVEVIGEDAFFNCNDLKSIYIPYSVTTIGKFAFVCENLKKITIANPWCELFEYKYENIFCDQTLDVIPKGVKIHGYLGSTANELSTLLGLPFVKIDKTEMDYPELKNKPVIKIKGVKSSYTLGVGKELKIPYTIENAGEKIAVVTGGDYETEISDGLSLVTEVAKIQNVTQKYVIIKGVNKGKATIQIRVGAVTKEFKVNVK
ncbi:leucine-rich repeat domain-containing protein [Lachnoclostridium sp.]|uniref:leucine-rich repeat domain-containing protein n=1 Tax=Lachnoclostridium sp. TaxID=2028282 RepID=UPI002897A3CA|nr:leucine-rich repeat domain-containing protein [Lachnoclostridium sp.]